MLHTDDKAKIHGLGFGRWPFIMSVPISTCDSSSWTNGSRYGALRVFKPDSGFSTARRKTLTDQLKMSKHALRLLGYLRRCNVSFDDLNDKEQWKATVETPSLPSATHAFAYLQFIYFLRQNYNVEYFLVLAHLGKSPHFETVLAVLASAEADLSTFDYQKFKKHYLTLRSIPKGEEFNSSIKRITEDFYDRLQLAGGSEGYLLGSPSLGKSG